MNLQRLDELAAKAAGSYVVHIDLRDLAELCEAARNLRMLVDAVRLLAARITILDEGNRFLELVADIPVVEGELV